MKRYMIGLIILLALISTGCEDAKAESKDYDVEIAELQQQVTQLNGRLDSLIAVTPSDKNFVALTGRLDSVIAVAPTNTDIVQINTNLSSLSSRLDSTIQVIPKKYNYEGVTDSQGNLTISIPGLQLEDLPVISFAGNDSEGFKLNIPMYMNIKNDMIYFNNVDKGQEIKIQIIK